MGSYQDAFRGTAWYYARYRPGYPEPFIQHIVDRFGLDGKGRLDLGTGTGHLAIPLAQHFEEVVGMDPEPEMLVEAAAQVSAAGVSNIKWVEGGSEHLERLRDQLGKFTLVTMGASFHWMDKAATLNALHAMVVPGGGILVVGSASIWNQEGEWQRAVKTVIQRWLGETRRAGSSTYVDPVESHESIVARSPFKRMETYRLQYEREWDINDLIGHLYSTSFASMAILGKKREGFEQDVRDTLLAINPSGLFTEVVELGAYLAWRDRN